MDDELLTLSKQDIRRLLGAGSGDAALLYLCLKSGCEPEQAAESLRMPAPRYEFALATLRQLGLVEEPRRVLDAEQRPVYTEQDVLREMELRKDFARHVGEVQRRLGRVLSTEELKILLSIRDYLGLPDEVVGILINFCKERNRARGNVRAPSLRSIEREAYAWADNGIDTFEAAAAYVQRQLSGQMRLGGIRRALQINDRRLTVSEEKYILKWLEMGFGEPEIALAYDRTCLQVGGLKWNYMNSILTSWAKQNLFTVRQIEQNDRGPEQHKPAPKQAPGQKPLDAMALKAIERMMKEES